MRTYKHPVMRQLHNQQVRFAPVEQRLEQLERAEKFMTEINRYKEYPYQYVCFRITGFRPESYPHLLLDGTDLEHDLGLLIEELSKSVPAVPPESVPEPVLTLDEVRTQYKVSTKTISRWRDRGLVSRRVLCNGRNKIGIRQSLLQRFLKQNDRSVLKSSRFSQMSEGEKKDILSRARRMAKAAPDRFTDICKRIAEKVGRSPETIRYTIKKHDKNSPDQAVFPGLYGPLNDSAKQSIYASYRRGLSIDALAKRFHRTRTSVYRVINEMRADRLFAQSMDYIPNPSFDDPKMEKEILAEMPEAEDYEKKRAKARNSAPAGLPPELAALYEVPLLTKAQEAHLFRKMNFLKHKASKLREKIDPAHARAADLDRLEEFQEGALAVRDQLIRCNMRLVASVGKRHANPLDNFFEILSDGNMSLMRAVEKFDFGRGYKFSTYATWSIMKNYARSRPDEQRRRERFMTGYEEVFNAAPDTRTDELEELLKAKRARLEVNELLEHLDERERRIIQLRNGLDAERGLTLEQVGKAEGITKERVRQLEQRTMNKLRHLAKAEKLELP